MWQERCFLCESELSSSNEILHYSLNTSLNSYYDCYKCATYECLRMNLGSMFFVLWLKGKWVKYFCCITSHSHLKSVEKAQFIYEANNIFFQSERKLWVKENVCYISVNENASEVFLYVFFSLPTLMAHLLLHNPEKIRFSPFYGNCKYGDMEKYFIIFVSMLLCTYKYINNSKWNIFYIIAFGSRSIQPCF